MVHGNLLAIDNSVCICECECIFYAPGFSSSLFCTDTIDHLCTELCGEIVWGADIHSENVNYILRISLSWGTALIYKGEKKNQNCPFKLGTVREPLLIVLHSKTTKHNK